MSLAERFEVVASCMFVDHVMVNADDEDSRPAILAAGTDVIVHGDDWDREPLLKQLGLTDEWLDEHGIVLRLLAYTATVSTSDILRRIRRRKEP